MSRTDTNEKEDTYNARALKKYGSSGETSIDNTDEKPEYSLRAFRDVCALLPLIMIIVPSFTITAAGYENVMASVINIIIGLFRNNLNLTELLQALRGGGSYALLVIAISCQFLSVACAVLNLVFLIIGAFRFLWKPNVAFCALADIFLIGAVAFFHFAISTGQVEGRVSPLVAVGLVLYTTNIIVSVIAGKGRKDGIF